MEDHRDENSFAFTEISHGKEREMSALFKICDICYERCSPKGKESTNPVAQFQLSINAGCIDQNRIPFRDLFD